MTKLTWFYNKVSEMPNKHLNYFKRFVLERIKATISYSDFDEFAEMKKSLIKLCQEHLSKCVKGTSAYKYWKRNLQNCINPSVREWKKYRVLRSYAIRKLSSRKISKHELLSTLRKSEPLLFSNIDGLRYYRMSSEIPNSFYVETEKQLRFNNYEEYLEFTKSEPKVTLLRIKVNPNGSTQSDELGQSKHIVKQFFKNYPNGVIILE